MQKIDSDLIRGNIDTIILKTMLNGDMYGLDIIREVENKSNGTYELKQPTLYSCLKRLENQELISSYWLDSDIGGKRHYYKLTEKGLNTIKSKQEEWSKSKFIIDNLLGDFNSNEYRLVKKDDYEKIIEGKPIIKYVEVPVEVKEPISEKNEISKTINLSKESIDESNDDEVNLTNDIEINNTENDEIELQNQPIEEPKVPEIKTISEYQSLIDNVLNTKSEIDLTKEENLITFNGNDNETDKTKKSETASNTENLKTISVNLFETESYKNHDEQNKITFSMNNQSFVQQNLFTDIVMPYQNEVDNSINDFNDNITKLNNFDYRDETKRQEEIEKQKQIEIAKSNLKQNEDETIEIQNDNTIQSDDTTKTELDCIHIEKLNTNILSELEILNSKNENIIDEKHYNEKDNKIIKQKENIEKNANSGKNNTHFAEKVSIFSNNNDSINQENTENNQNIISENQENNNSFSENSVETSEFLFETQNQDPEPFFEFTSASFTPTNENEPYKKKLQNLNEYTRNSLNLKQQMPIPSNTKQVIDLKKELESEGIKLKQYNKTQKTPSEKSYLLINKLNLIKSVILFFVYAFLLSGSYIIMKNTELKNIQDFSFNIFVYGMIPFLALIIFYLILFLINTKKKTTAKYSPRISMFFAIIITIQLLLIVYCVNLQFGFYSFTQKGYNHLYWIVPAIISFAPIINSAIHMGLYNSKNFHV